MISHLFDHTVRVNRLTEVVDRNREAVNQYVPAADLLPCAIVPPKFRPAQTDAGQQLTGITEAYFDADADIQRNDVLEVVAGPESPRSFVVLDTSRPRGHHTEAQCSPFTGTLDLAP